MFAYTDSYNAIVVEGYRANPPPEPVKKRGRLKKGRVPNMLDRLSKHRHKVFAFMEGFAVPFGNNQAERGIRMIKVKQKISGVFRSAKGAYILPNPQLCLYGQKEFVVSVLSHQQSFA